MVVGADTGLGVHVKHMTDGTTTQIRYHEGYQMLWVLFTHTTTRCEWEQGLVT